MSLNDWLFIFSLQDLAVSQDDLSASSFPSILQCPVIHVIYIFSFYMNFIVLCFVVRYRYLFTKHFVFYLKFIKLLVKKIKIQQQLLACGDPNYLFGPPEPLIAAFLVTIILVFLRRY